MVAVPVIVAVPEIGAVAVKAGVPLASVGDGSGCVGAQPANHSNASRPIGKIRILCSILGQSFLGRTMHNQVRLSPFYIRSEE
jgi:hypothetical protein